MKKEGKLSRIPFDVTREILLRLPARSVMRFRIACKLWRSATLDPGFVEAHLDLARKVSPPSILLTPTSVEEGHENNFIIVGGGGGDDPWTRSHTQRLSKRGCEYIWFHGSCNGIICISSYDAGTSSRSIHLMNPATGDSLTLPKPRHEISDVFFGIHPATKECKVAILYDISPPPNRHLGCQVYTVGGTDASWRDIDAIQDFEPYQATLLDGVVFSISIGCPDPLSIVTFDLKDESFKRFPLTDDFVKGCDMVSIRIVELQGSVCILLKTEQGRMDVWRFSTDGSGGINQHERTLLYSISPWDGIDPEEALFIHQDKILTMSLLYKKEDVRTFYTMCCYRYVKKGNFGVSKIVYMHQGCYVAYAHMESLVALPIAENASLMEHQIDP